MIPSDLMSANLNVGALSNTKVFGLPLRTLNWHKALINDLLVISNTYSKCVALVVMHVIKQTHIFVSSLFIFTINGLKQSKPTFSNGFVLFIFSICV